MFSLCMNSNLLAKSILSQSFPFTPFLFASISLFLSCSFFPYRFVTFISTDKGVDGLQMEKLFNTYLYFGTVF